MRCGRRTSWITTCTSLGWATAPRHARGARAAGRTRIRGGGRRRRTTGSSSGHFWRSISTAMGPGGGRWLSPSNNTLVITKSFESPLRLVRFCRLSSELKQLNTARAIELCCFAQGSKPVANLQQNAPRPASVFHRVGAWIQEQWDRHGQHRRNRCKQQRVPARGAPRDSDRGILSTRATQSMECIAVSNDAFEGKHGPNCSSSGLLRRLTDVVLPAIQTQKLCTISMVMLHDTRSDIHTNARARPRG